MRTAGWNLILIVAVSIAAEMLFGTWLFGPDFGTLNVPRDVRRSFDVSDLYGGASTTYTRDRHGLRGDYGGDPAAIDILAVGGSTTNEVFLSDDETWTATLQRKLRADGLDIFVANAGVDGQSTRGHLAAFDRWFPQIPGLSPSFVLLYVGINDIDLTPDDNHRAQPDSMRSNGAWRRFREYVQNHSALYRAFRIVRGHLKARRARLIHGEDPDALKRIWAAAPPPDLATVGKQLAPALAAYAERLRTLNRRIRAMGSKPVFITQRASTYRMVDGVLYGYRTPNGGISIDNYGRLSVFNRTTLAVCAEVEALCVDLAKRMDVRDGDFYDYVHTTPQGSARIADILHAALRGPVADHVGAPRP